MGDESYEENLLTQAERDEVAERLREKGATNACELCGHPDWLINSRLFTFQAVIRGKDGVTLGTSSAVPISILIHCKNCGNTKPINLNLAGLTHFIPASKDGRDGG